MAKANNIAVPASPPAETQPAGDPLWRRILREPVALGMVPLMERVLSRRKILKA